ncbi:deoxyuridine 5'-triphosphate nucleotidohydrolase [Caulobacter phage C1]|nr:deoxyuridine 5'-triphosphate nucleotidohydrolase [Caulobacter phage C1]UTU08427.1 deoxyuridine 5'-triphosphate nucleotidohydrolase [Caulobacter phage C2]UTU08944.1 deoxyuridine 5'-triphosphate nucleotidohydrolase [Caulobacter phage J4]UTU09500.1 deoxyuridine 5'-triphosphate nucleotidohydrolase [Caulobacter phage BL47]UTU10060.1 deoxyuridine 5'-triphosphate nucleotidohydrolase [Caulobacter phage RB23]WGN97095.1 deoxyuridine 5'-triphosphate nucleotidohydrolase [Bertelyvirus sp.]
MSVAHFRKLTPTAILPTRGSPHAAGLDLYYDGAKPISLWAGQTIMVSTGLAIEQMPDGCYARVAPRSGMSVKGSDVLAGVVDGDYRGEIRVVLHGVNYERPAIEINPGDRIAQLIFERYTHAEVLEVHETNDTQRGAGGFGSTGA